MYFHLTLFVVLNPSVRVLVLNTYFPLITPRHPSVKTKLALLIYAQPTSPCASETDLDIRLGAFVQETCVEGEQNCRVDVEWHQKRGREGAQ